MPNKTYSRLYVHAVCCYVAYIMFGVAATLADGGAQLMAHWGSVLLFGLLAPITVPAFMALSFRGVAGPHIEPHIAVVPLWGGYVVCLGWFLRLRYQQRVAERRVRVRV